MRPIEPTSEPQYKELLRLLEKEIAGVQEEFQRAEKLNQEKAAIERDACLAPDGEQWKMMLRREETLDRSLDRKVKILLGLRKKSPAPPVSTAGQGNDEETENVEGIAAASIPSQAMATQGASPGQAPISEVAEQVSGSTVAQQAKIEERSGNVAISKGPPWPVGPAENCQVKKCLCLPSFVLLSQLGRTKHQDQFTFRRRSVDFSRGGRASLLSIGTAQ